MRAAMSQLHLSARACHCTQSVKLVRTIADLEGYEEIQSVHSAEALQYCPKLMKGELRCSETSLACSPFIVNLALDSGG